MPPTNGSVYFAHGKESGPWGTKISQLAEIARSMGLSVESPDYSQILDPDARVERLLSLCSQETDKLILVGSSMGGYVSTVASQVLKPKGLFLMAPAFYIPNYANQDPVPYADFISIVHGWKDPLIPFDHSVSFAQRYHADLYLVDDMHPLKASIQFITTVFQYFLRKVLAAE